MAPNIGRHAENAGDWPARDDQEITKAKKINSSYVSRVLRLTLLAPPTVGAILNRRADAVPTLAEAMTVFPVGVETSAKPAPRGMMVAIASRTVSDALVRSCRILFRFPIGVSPPFPLYLIRGSHASRHGGSRAAEGEASRITLHSSDFRYAIRSPIWAISNLN